MESAHQPAGARLVSFGDGSQLGDVTIGDVALGSIVKLTINLVVQGDEGGAAQDAGALRAGAARLLDELRRALDRERHGLPAAPAALAPAPVGALLAHAAAQVDGLRRAAGVELTVELPAGAAPLLVDLPLAARAVAGLLDNAIRQSPPGGEVILRAAPADDAPFQCVEVRDFGRGLRPEELARIMAPGRPAPGRLPCAGLGIPFAQFAAESHGGQLRAASAPGRGSSFTLTFPAAG